MYVFNVWSQHSDGLDGRGKTPHSHWIVGYVGLDDTEKRKILPLPEIEPRPSSPSLYRLSYPDFYIRNWMYKY
jgi:hypothetical protein